jgi:dynactin complex subunit
VKTCADVQKEINELKKRLQQNKQIKQFKIYNQLSEQQKCDSESLLLKCEKCDCWKTSKEYYS